MSKQNWALTAALLALAPATARAQQTSDNTGYVETITVTGQRTQSSDQPAATSVLTGEDMERRGVARVSEALALLPGVSFQPGNRGGSRNEASVYVRGFDLSRVPVLLDGVPVYVPYDGYIDLNRLQTFDLEAVEVARGYASVLYGPNAMGGAINLVTRRPGEGWSGHAGTRLDFNRDLEHSGSRASVVAAYGADDWYVRGAVGWLDQDFWTLPEDFRAGLYQEEGDRLRSASEDLTVNLRAAWTPSNDEYAITYVRQEGAKQAPPYAENIASRATFFDWPYYDKESIYVNTRTAFGSGAVLSGRLYYDTFQNQLRRYDNVNYTTQVLPFAFTSSYNDYTYGGSAQLAIPLGSALEIRTAAFFKEDTHREGRPGGPISTMRDETGSLAAALRFDATDTLTLSAGVSYDYRDALEADNPSVIGTSFVVSDQDVFNWQAGLEYDLGSGRELFFGVSQKSRFATMYERYSYRLGFAQPNPGLAPEQLLTIEAGLRGDLAPWLSGSVGAFWGSAEDYIQSVTIGTSPTPPFSAITQFQNVGEVEVSGAELDLRAEFDWFSARLAYTYLDRDLTNRPGVVLFGTPRNSVDLELTRDFSDGFFGQVSATYRDGQLTTDAGNGSPVGSYTLLGLRGGWRSDDGYSVEVGVTNLLDELYEYDDGYPGQGRALSLALRRAF
jgi:iron complex outermembrane receptor protein